MKLPSKTIGYVLAILFLGFLFPVPKQRVLLIGDSYACLVPSELFNDERNKAEVDRAAFRAANHLQVLDLIKNWPIDDYDVVIVMWGASEFVTRGTSIERTQVYLDAISSAAVERFPNAHHRVISLKRMKNILDDPSLCADDTHPNKEGFKRLLNIEDPTLY